MHHHITLGSETDFDGWRKAARALALNDVKPSDVTWNVAGDAPELFAPTAPPQEPPEGTFSVSARFVELAQVAILHRNPERFALLYRLLWRLRHDHDLLDIATDPDVAEIAAMAKAVRRDEHKMHAFVRFREVGREHKSHFVAWFEPEHHIVELAAPFFARRFADMPWSILTPDVCAHWDGHAVSITPGVAKSEAPTQDRLEETWRRYYASIFNPARLKTAAMTREMPKRYWRNLPEARLIPELVASAESRTAAMVRHVPTEPERRIVRAALRASRDAPFEGGGPTSLEEVYAGVQTCRRCDLWRDATQGVAGEGKVSAKIMLVGEQPGDREDLAGQPFVGPAGKVLDKALAEAGAPRGEAYVTNAVKHFKHELRGKRRLHKTPDTGEVEACRWWLDHERSIVRPRVIVALGATAALSVFGRQVPIAKNRGQTLQLADQAQGVVTYHPSYLLRVPDPEAKAKAYAMFVEDLKFAWSLVA
jgi:probable DNA metabolism protein